MLPQSHVSNITLWIIWRFNKLCKCLVTATHSKTKNSLVPCVKDKKQRRGCSTATAITFFYIDFVLLPEKSWSHGRTEDITGLYDVSGVLCTIFLLYQCHCLLAWNFGYLCLCRDFMVKLPKETEFCVTGNVMSKLFQLKFMDGL